MCDGRFVLSRNVSATGVLIIAVGFMLYFVWGVALLIGGLFVWMKASSYGFASGLYRLPIVIVCIMAMAYIGVKNMLYALGVALELRQDKCMIDSDGIRFVRYPYVFWKDERVVRWEDIAYIRIAKRNQDVLLRVKSSFIMNLSRLYRDVDKALPFIRSMLEVQEF